MKIGYSKTFPHLVNGTWEKIWIEEDSIINAPDLLTLTDEEITKYMLTVRRVQYALKKQVESFFFESNKADEKKAEIKKLDDEVVYRMANPSEYELGEQIKSCTEITVLESYKFIVKGKKNLETIYNNRLKELT